MTAAALKPAPLSVASLAAGLRRALAAAGMAPGGAPHKAPRRLAPRYTIVAACFLATFAAYVERVGFSIAFTELAQRAGAGESLKGAVLSAFYWGYGVSQIPGGWAAQIYGGRVMLIISFAIWSLASLLTPGSIAGAGGGGDVSSGGDGSSGGLLAVWGIVAARVAVGVAQGFLIPSVHTVLSQWIPPHERARAVSLTTSGMYLGSAAAMLVLPSVAAAFGPASLLRVVGAIGLAWLGLWLSVGREVPHREALIPLATAGPHHGPAAAGGGTTSPRARHPHPADGPPPPGAGLGPAAAPARPSSAAAKGRTNPTPWRRMLRSPAIWAIVANNFAFHYAFYVIMNWLPTYFNSILKVELSALGPARTLPYVAMFLTSNAGGWAGDWLILRRSWGVGAARKAVNTLGMFASAGALLVMPSASSVGGGILLTTLTLAALGFSRGGFSVNHMDIAPKYAGVVMGLSNTAGTLSGVIGVAVTGHILEAAGGAANKAGWYSAHTVAAGICAKAAMTFAACARGDRLFD